MSSLQIGLLVFGALLLVGMLAHNVWQTRRNTPRGARGDAFDAGIEPTWDNLLVREAAGPTAAPGAAPLPVLGQSTYLDPLIDAIAPVALDGHSVSGEALLAALPSTRRVGSKPFAVEARPKGGTAWEFPAAGREYDRLQVGVQLANRTGAITEIEYSEFVVAARRYADAVSGEPQFPDMTQEVARARELDQFAREHDAVLHFAVRARGLRWSVGYVVQQAGQLGLVAGMAPGRMVLPSEVAGQPPILELGFDVPAVPDDEVAQQAVTLVTLGFDVPCVLRSEQPWERLCELAVALAEAMGGEVTDHTGQPLREDALSAIAADLDRLYAALDEHGLPAGAPETRRLFG